MSKVKAITTTSNEFHKMDELFKHLKLEETSLYSVKIKLVLRDDEEVKSFLFTGFKNGKNCKVFNTVIYDRPIKLEDILSIQIIKKLDKLI